MARSSSSLVVVAAIGSVLACAATLFQYISSHRLGQPGGYFPLALGATSIWLLVGSCGYFARAATKRSLLAAILQGLLAALAFLAISIFTLVRAFGS